MDSMRNRGLVDAKIDTSSGSGLSYGIQADGKAGPNGSVDKSVAVAQAQLIAAQQAHSMEGRQERPRRNLAPSPRKRKWS
ncbi:hypothetical protein ACFQT0_26820 [Hymenobacter humi]|uniref:Uncharacterized protein n=1 Tax=Hymenobacter humi TaxID=1411620 RepID=A0ABW2UE36_9BACT